MKANLFIEYWKEFSTHLNYNDNWNDSKVWTKHVIGAANCEGAYSPFGDFITTKSTDLIYWKEDKNIDFCLYTKEYFFNNIRDMNYKPDIKPLEGYYKNYEVILEHENQIEISFQEMVKLTTFKSKLKVLVTYDYEDKNVSEFTESALHLAHNFGEIIKQANDGFSENSETEYLLIIGRKLPEGNVIWKYISYNTKGEKIN